MYFRLEISRKMLAANPLDLTALLKSVSHYSLLLSKIRDWSLQTQPLPVQKCRDLVSKSSFKMILRPYDYLCSS